VKETVAYKNGEWMPRSQVTIELGDRGFYLGDAVFDLFRTFDGRPFRMKDHIDRFFRSAQFARLDPGFTPDELTKLTQECVERNEPLRSEFGDWSVWFSVTRGLAGWRTLDARPTFVMYAGEVPFYTFANQYAAGASAVITRSRNHTHQSLDPKVKHTSRMHLNLSDLEARDIDSAAWPIMLDMEGNIAEGSGSNVFVVSDGVMSTPSDATILRGVTRDVVFELAEQMGIPLSEEPIQPYDVYTADEVFFTSTPFSVLPVTRVDRRKIGDGRPGPVATRLLAAFSELAGLDVVDQALRFKNARSDN
jgi:branched-chain amino acid aminotransferase